MLLVLTCSGYRSRIESKDTRLFCLRVMVGVIILYDHVDPIGAFQKKSAIDVSVFSSVYIVTYVVCLSVPDRFWLLGDALQ